MFKVRILAQGKLFSAVSYFPYSYTVLTPHIIEILRLNSTEHHEKFKGALNVLLGPRTTPIIARHDWKFIRDVWPLVVKSMPSEKPSIVNLMNSLSDAMHRYFPTIAIKLSIPNNCLKAAYDWGNTENLTFDDFKEVIDSAEERLKLKSEEKERTYREVVNLLLEACLEGNLHWLYFSMALGCIRDLVHYDVIYDRNVVRFFLKALVNDSLAVRKIALKVALFILLQNKPKFKKVKIDPLSFSNSNGKKRIPGCRPDNEWLMYNSKTVPRNAKEWDELRYVHDQYSGFYDWPKEMKVYTPYSDQPTAAKRMNSLTEQEKEIYEFFSDNENLEKLIRYLSMEEKKGKDQFNVYRFLMFKTLFKLFEDELLPKFLPHLEGLVASKEEHKQRCAAEIMSGVMRGAKHWSYEQTEGLWQKFIPLLKTALANMSDETLSDWSLSITMCLESRDPNRYHWLLEFLLQEPLAEQTSFLVCGRLFILHNAVNQQTWRNAELHHRLLNYLKNHLSHSFQNVREKISNCLVILFAKDITFPNGNRSKSPHIEDLYRMTVPQLEDLYNDCLKKLQNNGTNTHIAPLTTESEKDTIKLFKTISKFATASIACVNYSYEHFQLVPLACILQNNDSDDELQNICTNILAALAHSMFEDGEQCLPHIFSAMRKVLSCPFWSARAVLAEFLPVLVFHNMATIISRIEWAKEVKELALQLLVDVQPEVRVKASAFLSGLVHCKFVADPLDLLVGFAYPYKFYCPVFYT